MPEPARAHSMARAASAMRWWVCASARGAGEFPAVKAAAEAGDVSAVVMKNLPIWAQMIRTPSLDVALMDDWDQKILRMAEVTSKENVTSILGIPTWTLVLIEKILELTGKTSILEVWPNFEFLVHGFV